MRSFIAQDVRQGAPPVVEVEPSWQGLGEDATRPTFGLSASPSPFRGSVLVRFTLPEPGRASVFVYSVDGRRVARLVDEELHGGARSIEWSGRDAGGRPVPPGMYFVSFQWRELRRCRLWRPCQVELRPVGDTLTRTLNRLLKLGCSPDGAARAFF